MAFLFQENYDDPHKTPASPVVHIRGLIDGVVEADLVEALQEFGPIRYFLVPGLELLSIPECHCCLLSGSEQCWFQGLCLYPVTGSQRIHFCGVSHFSSLLPHFYPTPEVLVFYSLSDFWLCDQTGCLL